MAKTFGQLSLCTAAATLVIGSIAAVAQADPRSVANIPDAVTSGASVPPAELPLPYESWQGNAQLPAAPARPREVPLPLARERELPRRSLELTAAFTALLPSCGAGSIDARGCVTVHPASGADVALLYRVSPLFGVGIEGVLGGVSEGSVRTRFGGVVGRLYFAESGVWDPYVALTIGAGKLTLPSGDGEGATSGIGGRVAGGIDYLLGTHWRVGPAASFAHWIAWSEATCERGTCRDAAFSYGRLLGFATLGVRVTGSFGEVL